MIQTETSNSEDHPVSVESADRRSSVLAQGAASVRARSAGRRSSVLAQGAASIRARSAGRRSLDKILLIVGCILVPIGIGAIILGWYGVAHTAYGFEQNSYIMSGGLLGLGLVFVGGFAYFGSWISRQIRTASRQHRQTMRVLERLAEDNKATVAAAEAIARLVAGYLGEPASPLGDSSTDNGATGAGRRRTTARRNGTGSPIGARVESSTITTSLVATKRGTLVHRPNCPIVVAKGDLKQVEPGEQGYGPCRICAPEVG